MRIKTYVNPGLNTYVEVSHKKIISIVGKTAFYKAIEDFKKWHVDNMGDYCVTINKLTFYIEEVKR